MGGRRKRLGPSYRAVPRAAPSIGAATVVHSKGRRGRSMLPTGTVTFLMTDVEDSTGLVERLGDRWDEVLTRQRALIRSAVRAAGGEEIDVHGDEVFTAFSHASA